MWCEKFVPNKVKLKLLIFPDKSSLNMYYSIKLGSFTALFMSISQEKMGPGCMKCPSVYYPPFYIYIFFIYIEMPFYIYDIQCKVSYADKHIRPWIFCLVKVNGDEDFFFFFLVHNLVDTMDMENGDKGNLAQRSQEMKRTYNFAVCSTVKGYVQNEKQDTWVNKYSMQIIKKKKKKIMCYPMAHLMSSGCHLAIVIFLFFKNKNKILTYNIYFIIIIVNSS